MLQTGNVATLLEESLAVLGSMALVDALSCPAGRLQLESAAGGGSSSAEFPLLSSTGGSANLDGDVVG
jgi:hypothetical protein